MATGVSIITLGVHDLPRAVAFYADGMGFDQVHFDSNKIAFFDAGGVQLALFPWEELAKDATVDAGSNGFRGVTLARNVDTSGRTVLRCVGARQFRGPRY